jgi:hypothetical protein
MPRCARFSFGDKVYEKHWDRPFGIMNFYVVIASDPDRVYVRDRRDIMMQFAPRELVKIRR